MLARRSPMVPRLHFAGNSKPVRTTAALAALLAAILTPALQARGEHSSTSPLTLRYRIVLTRPTTHLIEVDITASEVNAPTLDFVLPAWSPGRYAIYNFAKNVQGFEAEGANGQPLAWWQPDTATWRVETSGAGGTVGIRYQVFANDLTGSFSQFDTTHAALNGASLFMYVAGHKPDPLTLAIDAPPGWKIYSGFSLDPDGHEFRVRDYDLLVDTPLEISPDCTVDQFEEGGKAFRVVIHNRGEADALSRAALVEGLKKIVASEMAMMPAPDFEHYTFLFHFDPGIAAGDGMEHLNSTDIIMRSNFSAQGVEEALETAAHEFFHLWNVKRLRPAGLGPFHYTGEVYTPSLWFAEGVTQYYSYVHLFRSGLWSRSQFLDRLAGEIMNLRDEPGRKLMSAESSSFHAWFYDRAPQMQETNFANSTISYYNKGALLALLLDLEIRERTGGHKSLDGVMRLMYRKFYEAPAATYYGPGRGYQESDILAAINEVAGADFSDFFKKYVAGTAPLPYSEVLAAAGLKLQVAVLPDTPPSLGVLTQPIALGLKIVAVRPGGAADRAGLSRDDLLIAVDDRSLATDTLADRLQIYSPGASVPFTVERLGRRMIIFVTLDPPQLNSYSILPAPDATPAEVEIRQGWLGQ